MGTILEAKGLKKYFPVTRGILYARTVGYIKAVDDIDFPVAEGETLSLVGESGCGKTTTAKLILREEKPTGGSIMFRGKDINEMRGSALQEYRTSVQAVFQDPFSSLSPRLRVGSIIGEPLRENGYSRAETNERVSELLSQVSLPPGASQLYPHEFSGGQRQRIAVARALSLNPKVIVLDEPVSALDVSIRAQIMNLLKDLQGMYGTAYLLIAHDLATVRYMSDHAAVMYLGKIVESGPNEEIYTQPLHPYTQALLSAALPSHPRIERNEIILSGEVPSAFNPPSGCSFHPRCPHAMPICSELAPQLQEVSPGHRVGCHLYSNGDPTRLPPPVTAPAEVQVPSPAADGSDDMQGEPESGMDSAEPE